MAERDARFRQSVLPLSNATWPTMHALSQAWIRAFSDRGESAVVTDSVASALDVQCQAACRSRLKRLLKHLIQATLSSKDEGWRLVQEIEMRLFMGYRYFNPPAPPSNCKTSVRNKDDARSVHAATTQLMISESSVFHVNRLEPWLLVRFPNESDEIGLLASDSMIDVFPAAYRELLATALRHSGPSGDHGSTSFSLRDLTQLFPDLPTDEIARVVKSFLARRLMCTVR
eukprot:jgi/Bigna1/139244/aug1.49_g13952